MLWVIENPGRFLEERRAISDLAARVDWLHAVRWGVTAEALIKVDVDIMIGGETFDVELAYPNLFPDTPAYVRPRSATTRWSSHQFGAGGVLCLEWGPDNWSTAVKGSDLLESTYRLLSSEHASNAVREPVPSRHSLTFGQEVRASTSRIVFTPALREYLRNIPSDREYGLGTRSILHRSTVVVFISEVSRADGDPFTPGDMPSGLLHYGPLFPWARKGRLLKSESFTKDKRFSSSSELLTAIHEAGFKEFKVAQGPDEDFIVLVTADGVPRAFRVETTGEHVVREYTVTDAGEAGDERRPSERQTLIEKKVGIVGLGSVGSKVAVSLARCGIRRFLLVDDDVLRAENVCRNELDWAWVGENKVDAVKEALLLVGAGIDVQIRRTRIAGQESPESASTALDSLAACDLLIDATASASVLVQLAAIAKRRKKALIWGEVFAGGIGALLVRSRPGTDPEPLAMLSGLNEYLKTLPEAPFRAATRYDAERDSTPLIAFDAEVSQFAATLTAFALDTLLEREPSTFPESAYLIGYKRDWIFAAPFDVQPVRVQPPAEESNVGHANTTEERAEAIAVLAGLITQQTNADPKSAP